jgi:AAHS family 4-hydroxybenzoate transporter-like MFS transporter
MVDVSLEITVILCGLVLVFDGFDTQSIAFVAPSLAKDWGTTSTVLGPVFGAGLFGLLVGAAVFGPLADRIGRRMATILSSAIFAVFALLTAWADNSGELLALRFLTGVGLGGRFRSCWRWKSRPQGGRPQIHCAD